MKYPGQARPIAIGSVCLVAADGGAALIPVVTGIDYLDHAQHYRYFD